MAHFAEVDENNIVLRVLVVDDLHESDGQNFLANTLGLGGTWHKTSYNSVAGTHLNGGTHYRYNYAGIGYTFDPDFGDDGAFIPPKPFDSWLLGPGTATWKPPVPEPVPAEGERYTWNEETTSWDLVTE
jgi:hypothetical protein